MSQWIGKKAAQGYTSQGSGVNKQGRRKQAQEEGCLVFSGSSAVATIILRSMQCRGTLGHIRRGSCKKVVQDPAVRWSVAHGAEATQTTEQWILWCWLSPLGGGMSHTSIDEIAHALWL